ncbi:MAG: hypothetical protein Q9227_008282 [Pyrenula ochraceoflavens]
MDSMSEYKEPKALIVLSGIFLALGAIFLIVNVVDIIRRRGWKSMMWIMIPVWPINAAYIGPLTLYLYFKFGRPTKPSEIPAGGMSHCHGSKEEGNQEPANVEDCHTKIGEEHGNHEDNSHESHGTETHNGHEATGGAHHHHSQSDIPREPSANLSVASDDLEKQDLQTSKNDHSHMHMHHDMGNNSRPMWATVLIGVSHCGAGCVLGDLVGEWLVYGTGVTLNGQMIWVELLIDYAFALLFGIIFQYFSIAPMSGEYGVKTVVRAVKADILSLTSFEIGLFGWMVAYQVGIWNYRLEMTTWTYWWMMQVGMILGAATAFPVNWFLIGKGIKEPCA